MFVQDEALIYKQYESLYYAITKKNGKIILKHYYFQESYPSIKSFFFVNYEYSDYQFKQAENKNMTSLIIQNMELDYIVPLSLIGEVALLFQYIFDYCIEYKVDIKNIWDDLFFSFHQNSKDKIDFNFFIFNLLFSLSIVDVEDFVLDKNNENINYKNNIINILVGHNPQHNRYIKKIMHE